MAQGPSTALQSLILLTLQAPYTYLRRVAGPLWDRLPCALSVQRSDRQRPGQRDRDRVKANLVITGLVVELTGQCEDVDLAELLRRFG